MTNKRLSCEKHLKDICLKMKFALGSFLGVLTSLKRITLEKKKLMAKACINSVALYGTEVTLEHLEYSKVIEDLEKIQRRYMRNLVGASQNVANETLLTELDLPSIREEMAIRMLKLRARLECDENSFIGKLFTLCKQLRLKWEIKYERLIKYYNMPYRSFSELENKDIEIIKNSERLRRYNSLVSKSTTNLYRKLCGNLNKKKVCLYLKENTHRKRATRILFGLRTGSNHSMMCQYSRCLKISPFCVFYPKIIEDEAHIIEECPLYNDARTILRENLKEKILGIYYKLTLVEIVLNGKKFEKYIRENSNKTKRKVDSIIKNFVESIDNKRKQLKID
ncbi:hypothetical protein SteCoe_30153 [Stentor coeruleus]|uniref:Uncharacterized protein n=1 Tax=Stentor coeruleus TaxID=5963 RepID=A0A1R2B4B7_9CILI|nr:hypothetical protein SteCoe_30153 [Stentor coeruleus]